MVSDGDSPHNCVMDKPLSRSLPSAPDRIYRAEQAPAAFVFDDQVAAVFPDMIERSVPGYDFVLQLTAATACRLVQPHSRLYDLGCSLGAFTLAMRSALARIEPAVENVRIVAVDSAPAMIERARGQIEAFRSDYPVDLICADIRDVCVEDASLVVLAYTLQFLPIAERLPMLQAIARGLAPGGALILVEKTHEADARMQALLTELHLDFKRANGYSELEIARKRQALENILLTETVQAHEARMHQAGFDSVAVVARHYGFTAWIARRSGDA